MMALFMTCLTPEASSKLKCVGKNDLYVVIKAMKVLYYIQWPLQIDSVFDKHLALLNLHSCHIT